MNHRIVLPLVCALVAVSAGCSKPNPPASTETPAAGTMPAPTTDPAADPAMPPAMPPADSTQMPPATDPSAPGSTTTTPASPPTP